MILLYLLFIYIYYIFILIRSKECFFIGLNKTFYATMKTIYANEHIWPAWVQKRWQVKGQKSWSNRDDWKDFVILSKR